jgi:uncharacterized protein
VTKITYDATKRAQTLKERGLDFADAASVFAGPTLDVPDTRRDYGEPRTVTVGFLLGRMVVIVWTLREGVRRVISMRKANDREQARFEKQLGQD